MTSSDNNDDEVVDEGVDEGVACLVDLLAERHAPPAWAFFTEVGSSGGVHARRRCDAMAVAIWPSLGMELHGFEIKASRSDWLREKKDAAKAAAFFDYCDRWWLVVENAKVATIDELPSTWGLLVRRGSRLFAARSAPQLNAKPFPRELLAGMCHAQRRAFERQREALSAPTKALEDAAFERGRASGQEMAEIDSRFAREKSERLQEIIDVFERDTGIPLSSERYRLPKLAQYVRAALALPAIDDALDHVRSQLQHVIDAIDDRRPERRPIGRELDVLLRAARQALEAYDALHPEVPR